MKAQTMNGSTLPQRRWDIDWLRVMAVVLLLVPYHTFRVFDIFEDWYVKNAQLSTALNWFNYLGDAVGMQLLFLLAGAATWFALRRRCVVSWFLIVALLGYGKKYLNSPPKRRSSLLFLGYFGEGSYPFYILHQTVIVIIGFYVVQWATIVPVKYLAIAAAAYVVTIALYDLLVRRTNVTRFLFGMRPMKQESLEAPTSRPGKSAA